MANKLKVYKTTFCPTCKVAFKRLDAAGLPYTVVNVEEDAEAAARLKREGFQQAPVFGWKGALHTIADFPRIFRELSDQEAAA